MDIKKEDLCKFVNIDADEIIELNIKLDKEMVDNINKLLESQKFLFKNSKIDDMITYLLIDPINDCLKQLEDDKSSKIFGVK